MNIIDIINKTKRRIALADDEIKWLVSGYTNGTIPDYQMSAWLMAVCLNGLTESETVALTLALRDSGEIMHLDLPLTADKHSTGGVGDKTSMALCPRIAALLSVLSQQPAEFLWQKCQDVDLAIQAEQSTSWRALRDFAPIFP